LITIQFFLHYVIIFVEGGFPPRRVCLRYDIHPDESGFDESNPYRATVKLGFRFTKENAVNKRLLWK